MYSDALYHCELELSRGWYRATIGDLFELLSTS